MIIFNKRNERIDRYNEQVQNPGQPQPQLKRVISDLEMFKLMEISGGSA